jgi:hypothetical protein
MASKPKKTKEQIKSEKAGKKDDTESDNFRNRLARLFPAAVLKKDGGLPSPIKGLVQLALRTWANLKYGQNEALRVRDRIVTVGVQNVLNRDVTSTGGALTGDELAATFMDLSSYASKVRVMASLLANFIFMEHVDRDEPVPEADAKFYSKCLQVCRSTKTNHAGVTDAYQRFTTATGMVAEPARKGVSTLFERQVCDTTGPMCRDVTCVVMEMKQHAMNHLILSACVLFSQAAMEVAAKNCIDVHFRDRQITLLKWALRSRLFRYKAATVSTKTFGQRMHTLTEKILSDTYTGDQLRDLLRTAGMSQDEAWQAVQEVISTFIQECGETHALKRAYLLRMQRLYLTADKRTYDQTVISSHEQFPGDTADAKQQRALCMKQNWQYDCSPPKESTPLPICSNRATFVQYDKKVLEEVFPVLRGHLEGPWGYTAFMSPFSKAANIPCLRSKNHKACRSEQLFFQSLQNADHSQSPWMVACSFLTDGIQMKLLMHTVEQSRPTAQGMRQLALAGYRGDGSKHTLTSALESDRGVYILRDMTGTAAQLQDVHVTACDPGQVLLVDGPRALGSEFTHSRVAELLRQPVEERCQYSAQEYKIKTLRFMDQMKQDQRRRGVYAAALQDVPRKRTAVLAEFITYCQHSAQHWSVIWNEVLHKARRLWAFSRYRAQQSGIESVCERIAPAGERWKKRVVFFGAASFAAAKGAAGVPRKKILQSLGLRVTVVMVPEQWTSQTCPGCEKRLQDEPGSYRTKLCTTAMGCPLHPDTATASLERDAVGGLNTGFRGMRHFSSVARTAV